MDTEHNPVANWGSLPKIETDTPGIVRVNDDALTAALQTIFTKAYHRGHLHGFLLGIAAGGALASAVMGVLFYG